MDTNHTPAKSSLHPVLVIAAVAVILFCGVGSAALMGWLPNSNANGSGTVPPAALVNEAPPANAPANSLNANGAYPNGNYASGAYPNGAPAPALAAAAPAPAPVSAAAPAPAVCGNCGVVESVREIQTRAQGSGVGAAGGAILGGLLGNQVGSGHGRQLATVAGAVGGAVAGNQIEGNMKATRSYEIVVRMDNGKTRTLHQKAAPAFRSGDAVRIVNGQLRAA
ncbi:glycine zipper 2TM domain-containing protein [Oxalobacteraceae bacterium A2-2]